MSDPLYDAGYRILGHRLVPAADMVDGQMALDDALRAVQAHASPLWNAAAYACGAWLSTRCDRWTTDDLWAELAHRYPEVTTHEPRALGPVIQRLKRDGKIDPEPTQYVKSHRPENHMRPIPVYRSLVRS